MSKRTADDETEEFPLDKDVVEKMRRGFAGRDAGQTISLEKARANTMAALAAICKNSNA